jgi:hypothetical protein
MPQSITTASVQGTGSHADFPNIIQAMKQLADNLAKRAKENLVQTGHVATGALVNSIVPGELQVTGDKLHIDILALDYLQYINKGVRGTKGGQGLFSFKGDHPSQAMISSITKWIGNKAITAQATQKGSGKHGNAKSSITKAATAYAIARSIMQHGIKPTGFFDAAMATTQQQADTLLANALKVDVINALPDTL